MEFYNLYFQIHKYKNGHQLIASTIELERSDQDMIDRLSDLSGQIRPGEFFEPYFTCYPLPSEKQFIVARTWQDITAPRAGCVLTKSIIIPMKEWENLKNVSFLFDILLNSPNDLEFPFPDKKLYAEPNFRVVNESPLEELVEALFLEQRKPILVFDGKEKIEVIKRLYNVFWPGLRRNFATCTFALATRTIKNRTFDLLFTDSNLRTRFSDWNGRRIEGSSVNKKLARHRWTVDLVDRIFKNDYPSLFKQGEESPFDFKNSGDESILRLSLLWQELVQKAVFEASPMSILGLLDIINSQENNSKLLYERLESQILESVSNASKMLKAIDAWKFYGALLVKHKRNLMSRVMLSEVHYACKILTAEEPSIAIEFITNFNPSLETIPAILYSSIGDGIALSVNKKKYVPFKDISNSLGLLLLATSKNFAGLLMEMAANDNNAIQLIIKYLKTNNEKSLRRAKNNLLPFVNASSHTSVFEEIISSSGFDDYLKICTYSISNFALTSNYFDDIIFEETIQNKAFSHLLEILILAGKFDNLLVRVLQHEPELFVKFVFDDRISTIIKDKIIIDTFKVVDLNLISTLAPDDEISNVILQVLQNDKKLKKEILVEFAFRANLSPEKSLNVLGALSSNIINTIDQERLFSLLTSFIGESEISSDIIKVINKLNQNKTDLFVSHVFRAKKDPYTIPLIFETLYISGTSARKSLIQKIDYVSEYLAHNLPDYISKEFAESWVDLLNSSTNRDKKRIAAITILKYSYRTKIKDPTLLIAESFPIVYESFLKGKSVSQSLAFWIFPDWDKCKILREDLVDRYIKTGWSKVGLFIVADKTGIMKEIFSILNDKRAGKKFIKEAVLEAKVLDSSLEIKISRLVKRR